MLHHRARYGLLGLLTCLWAVDATAQVAVSGTLEQWRPLQLDCAGPEMDALGTPNPFLDFRLQVRFTGPGGQSYDVPGYFAGDGAGGQDGGVWRVLFSPDAAGHWTYAVSFRAGDAVAIALDPEAGTPAAFDGASGSFEVRPPAEDAPGFYRWGRLEYVGGHYLKFRDGGYWLKGGTDSPEDLLAYAGFSGTPRASHHYAAHVQDWREGDPDWNDGAGRGIIGALNYLAAMEVNSIYFLPMNIGGDGKNVWPYLGKIQGKGSADNENLRFDNAKLAQWNTVFEHAQSLGIFLHFVLNEAEEPNKRELDDGALGTERKVYYRELAARFGHHLALQWNLCEEYNLGYKLDPSLVQAYAEYLRAVDPYGHPITVHHAGQVDQAWAPFLGHPLFAVTSFQTRDLSVVARWRAKSREAGFPQVIGMDEFFPDKAHPDNADRHRREYLWPIYLSGGQLEYILDELLKTEDFRKYAQHWREMAHARRFVQEHLPFWEMEAAPHLVTGAAVFQGLHNAVGAQVFAKEAEVYAVYLPIAGSEAQLDLSAAPGTFVQRWYNPRTGTFAGESVNIQGGGVTPLGAPPERPEEDWVALVARP